MLFRNLLDLCNQAVPTTAYEHAQEYVLSLYIQVINSNTDPKKLKNRKQKAAFDYKTTNKSFNYSNIRPSIKFFKFTRFTSRVCSLYTCSGPLVLAISQICRDPSPLQVINTFSLFSLQVTSNRPSLHSKLNWENEDISL